LVDPIVVASSKLQSIVGIIGPMIVYVESDQTAVEINIGIDLDLKTINQLNDVMQVVQMI
jgi:carboxylesterase